MGIGKTNKTWDFLRSNLGLLTAYPANPHRSAPGTSKSGKSQALWRNLSRVFLWVVPLKLQVCATAEGSHTLEKMRVAGQTKFSEPTLTCRRIWRMIEICSCPSRRFEGRKEVN